MRKLLSVLAITGLLMSCNTKKSEDAVQTIAADSTKSQVAVAENLGKATVYEGVLPCADCSGIATVLKIYAGDGTMENQKFELISTYQGKEPADTFTEKGNFNTERGLGKDPNGTIYILNYDKPEKDQVYYGKYSSEPEKIYMLDRNRQIIESKLNYSLILKK